MGLFSFLTDKSVKSVKKGDVDYVDDKFLEVSSQKYFGEYNKSLSGKWVISWRDANSSGTRGGFRDNGPGQYLVIDVAVGQVVLKGRLQRPNSGRIADNGRFSMEDWLFGNGLKGKFYVFSPDGTKLLEKKLEANIFNSDISPDGRFAVCQTANAGPPHGNRLFVFDIDAGVEAFSVTA